MTEPDPLDPTRDYASSRNSSPAQTPATMPARIGRYRVERLLGRGSFGIVYLAWDEQLDRHVAIKVPHAGFIDQPDDAASYLDEARMVASLDHPHIVPVYDVGSDEEFPCFVISKFVEGASLSERLRQRRFSLEESVRLTATVAEALHYAHLRGLVHRDIKPANILLDSDERPYVVDFGLALRHVDMGKGPRLAGTPAFMSPEQARGEGNQVDGRSDVFSLGVVLYLLLTGQRPFQADSSQALLQAVACAQPSSPRQLDSSVPDDLERICLKALAKVAGERFGTAREMAEALNAFLVKRESRPPNLAEPAPRAEQERRQVTVVACDLAGSLVLSEDPEDMQR